MAIHAKFEDLSCAGPTDAGLVPCPQAKTVRKHKQARGPLRCPDCHLENKRRMVRRRLPALRQEQTDLQRRIEQSAPPASIIEGQIQRRVRDKPDDEPGEDETVLDIDEDAIDEIEPDPDAAIAEEAAPSRPGRRLRDPKLRQVETPRSTSGSWWVGKSDDSFKSAADRRAEELRGSAAAAKVKSKLNFV